MEKIKSNVAKYLKQVHSKKYAVFFGRASTALYCQLKAISPSGGNIVMPAIVCPSVPLSAYLAGWRIKFCDIDIKTYNISFNSLKKIITTEENIDAICIPHLYHGCMDINKIAKFLKNKNIYLIEDCAQAFGSIINNKIVGSFGNAAIFSFGHTKQLDIGGGGALLTNDPKTYKKITHISKTLPAPPKDIRSLSKRYRKLYYENQGIKNFSSENIDAFVSEYKKLYIYNDMKVNYKILKNKIDNYKLISNHYQNNYDYLYNNLTKHASKLISLPFKNDKAIAWRFSFLINNNRDNIVNKLREHSLDVSTWYPALIEFPTNDNSEVKYFQNSLFLEKSIINLWIDDKVKQNYLDRCLAIIKKYT